MPMYSYMNTETNEEWSEIRSMDEADDGVDGVKIIRVLSAPNIFPSEPAEGLKRGADFQKNIMEPKLKALGAKYNTEL